MGKGHQSNRQKGFASNMNQMERGQINRYYDNQPRFAVAYSSDQFSSVYLFVTCSLLVCTCIIY